MEKSKVPFKTNVNQSIRVPAAGRASGTARAKQTVLGGKAYWLRPENRPIRATLVDEDVERALLLRKLLSWLLIVPFAVMVVVRFVLLIFTMLQ